MKEYLATFDARVRELSATVKDPKLMVKGLLKVLPPHKDGSFIVNMNINSLHPARTGEIRIRPNA